MEYQVLHADLDELPPEAADAFIAAAAEFGVDVDDLTPVMGVDPTTVALVSSALSTLALTISQVSGRRAGDALWSLLARLPAIRRGAGALADHETGVTFVFDRQAVESGEAAANMLIRVAGTLRHLPTGTVLRWNAESKDWVPDRR